MTLILGLAAGIGLLLGMLGGGGSILTVPMLVYLAAMPAKTAMATSLVVVGTTSVIAMLGHARGGRVCWNTGLVFAVAGMGGAYGGGRLAGFVPGSVLLLLFGVIMLATAAAMLRGRKAEPGEQGRSQPLCPRRLPILPILFDGIAVGTVTGLVGAGGGFLVVPALNLLGGLPMRAAVGTSLLVVALQSFAALAGYASHVELDLHVTGLVTAATVIGSLAGGRLSQRVSPARLRRGFGLFVATVGGYLLYRELTPEVVADVAGLALAHREFLWGVLTVIVAGLLYRLRALLRHCTADAGRPPLSGRGKLR